MDKTRGGWTKLNRVTLVAMAVAGAAAMTQAGVVVVAAEGDPAAGGGTFAGFRSNTNNGINVGPLVAPALNGRGEIVYRGQLVGAANEDTGLFGGLVENDLPVNSLIAREGQAAPAGDGTFDGSFGDFIDRGELVRPEINGNTRIAFRNQPANVNGTTTNGDGIFVGSFTSAPVAVARSGQPAPGTDDVFTQFDTPVINSRDEIAFSAALNSSTAAASSGIFVGDTSATRLVARSGQTATGGGTIIGFDRTIAINAPLVGDAQVAYLAAAQGGANGSSFASDYVGVFRGDGTAANDVAIARRGDVAPGTFGGTFQNFEPATINNLGVVAFRVTQIVGSTDGGTRGLFAGNGTATTEIVRRGETSPFGGTFNDFSNPALNDVGQVAFAASITGGSTGLAILRADLAAPTVAEIAFLGQTLATGDTLVGINAAAAPALNENGQVAFLGSLEAQPGGAARPSILLFDDDSGLMPTVTVGDALLGQTITELGFSFGSSDAFTGLNDVGQIAFSFGLSDGRTGIGLWTNGDTVVVPIPSPLAAGGGTLVGLLALRRRAA